MRIEQFDPVADTGQIRACFELTNAGWASDHPTMAPWMPGSFAAKWTDGFTGAPQESWLAVDDDGQPVGAYLLRLTDRENTSLASCIVIVHPGRRRSGIGRALVDHCSGRARRADRTRLAGMARDGSPGAAFAAGLGAEPGSPSVDRLLRVDGSLPARLAALRSDAEQHSAGYSLVSWSGPTPPEQLSRMVALKNAMADAPRDEGMEPTRWDADRLRSSEERSIRSGLRYYSVLARHDESGEGAALTQLCVDAGLDDWAFQLFTVVARPHRGRRLGLLVKIENLRQLMAAEPAVAHVTTGNDAGNDHMIAINKQLGFEPADTYRYWALDLA